MTIPSGVPVLLLTGAATRDEREFEEPDRFDVDRSSGHGARASATGSTPVWELRLLGWRAASRSRSGPDDGPNLRC